MATKLSRNKRFKYQRPPTAKFGNFTLKYHQEPYEDRYFLVIDNGMPKREIMRLPYHYIINFDTGSFNMKPFWFISIENNGEFDKINNFIDRCIKYNEYLDKSEP